ncbi:MAG: hypothetical protein JSR77_03630 [Planctomycetes bacterium]|nr:hypothetical protein [Planctomycetota bacterium]
MDPNAAYLPATIEDFVKATRWGGDAPPHGPVLDAMRRAFDFFKRSVPRNVLADRATQFDIGPNPWGLTLSGRVTRLCAWMQAIRFENGVNDCFHIDKSYKLVAFRDPGDKQSYGNWYTFTSTDPQTLAILKGQSQPRFFRTTCAFTCLRSTASDTFAIWGIPQGKPAQYSAGGGNQLFIPNSRSVLELWTK